MKKVLLALTMVLVVATAANAGQHYVSGSVSTQYLMDSDISSNDSATNAELREADAKVESGWGWGLSAASGYQWESGIRVELEGSYFSSDLDKITSNIGNLDVGGKFDMTALMVNALYEYQVKEDSPLSVYGGLGFGYGWSYGELDLEGDDFSDTASIPLVQPIAGLRYRIDENWSVQADYKFMAGLEKLDYGLFEAEYRSHRMGLGLRYDF
jgi:opacity protein-like surface antigen